jgi:hypothetical protein
MFCEEYISHMQKVLPELLRKGPTEQCSTWGSELADIRLKYRTWLTSEIQEKILPFEQAFFNISLSRSRLGDLEVGEERTKIVRMMHDTFAEVLGLSSLRDNSDEDVTARRIMDHLQDILGVKQLIKLRIALVDKAVKTLENKK